MIAALLLIIPLIAAAIISFRKVASIDPALVFRA